jgi:NAD(P)-dependent dehydrogenase (short-subunit alcohol dehydrogenase family)
MAYNILITGANRGLGLALTEQLLAGGHNLFALSRHDSAQLEQLQQKYALSLHRYACDVSEEASIRQVLLGVGQQTDTLDIVLNNAAVHLDPARLPLEEVDFSVYLPAFQANSVGPLMVARYALPYLRKGQRKLIVNFSSEAGSIGMCSRQSEYSYCMSKSALNMGSRILQNYLKDEGIKVIALQPGWFSSDMGGEAAPITPAEAAAPILKLILDPPGLDEPMYVDSSGEALEW